MGVFSLQSLPKTLQKTTQGTGEISRATQAGQTKIGNKYQRTKPYARKRNRLEKDKDLTLLAFCVIL